MLVGKPQQGGMVRRLPVLSTAFVLSALLIAMFGMSSASGASFETPAGGTTTLEGARNGAAHKLLVGETYSCSNVNLAGTVAGSTSEELVVSPELQQCAWVNGQVVNWSTNGCQYRFRVGSGSQGSLDIINCASALKMTAASCLVEIGNQNGLGPVTYSNVEVGGQQALKIRAEFSTVRYTKSGAGCPPSGTFTNGSYTGEWIVQGRNSLGEPVPLKVNSGGPHNFKADSYPASVSGSRNGKLGVFGLGLAGTLQCSTHALTGDALSAASSSVSLVPSYAGCWMSSVGEGSESTTTVSAGACKFGISASGGFAIAGAECASKPITITYKPVPSSTCTITIGPQSGLTGLTVTNSGWSTERGVQLGGSAEGLTYTASGSPSACDPGTRSSGTFRGNDRLSSLTSSGSPQGLFVE